jgi:hypothetical protein
MGAEKKGSTTVTVADPASSAISITHEAVKFNAEALIAQAIEKGTDVNTMERLLAMRRELKSEWAKEQYDLAMAAFQEKCPVIEKKKKVSFGTTNYSYAPLEDIVEQVKTLLSKNGFSYTFDSIDTDTGVTIFCYAKHRDGHMEKSQCTITTDNASKMNISQKSGAAMTYGKRYAFCNAFGILTGDEDTDANMPKPQNAPQSNANPAITQSVGQAPKQAALPNQAPITAVRTVRAIISSMEIAAGAKDIPKLERLRNEFQTNITRYTAADNALMREAILRIQKEIKGA